MENWQSEYLQFALFALATVWLLQRGSPESNSLIIAMGLIFLASWFAQSVTGWTAHNQELQSHGEPHLSWLSYVGSSEFWEATLQNWQSEFLAVGSFAILAVYLAPAGLAGVEAGRRPDRGRDRPRGLTHGSTSARSLPLSSFVPAGFDRTAAG